MIHAPVNLDRFMGVIVDIFALHPTDISRALDLFQPYMRNHLASAKYPSEEDYHQDSKVLVEVLRYTLSILIAEWARQVPAGIQPNEYTFGGWSGNDIIFKRR